MHLQVFVACVQNVSMSLQKNEKTELDLALDGSSQLQFDLIQAQPMAHFAHFWVACSRFQ